MTPTRLAMLVSSLLACVSANSVVGQMLVEDTSVHPSDQAVEPARAETPNEWPELVFEYQGIVSSPGEPPKAPDSAASAAELNERAYWHFFKGEYEEARGNLNEAVKKAPPGQEKSVYLANRGIMHRMLGDPAKAREDYNEAIRLDDNNSLAQNSLGRLLALEATWLPLGPDRDQKIAAARAAFEKASEDRRCMLAIVNLAALESGTCDDARRKQLQNIAKDGDEQDSRPWVVQLALLQLGEAARCRNEWIEAKECYQKAYEMGKPELLPPAAPTLKGDAKNHENPWILQRLGAAEYVLGSYDDAGTHLGRAAEIFGNERIEGRYARLLGQLAEARRDKSKQIELATGNREKAATWIDVLELQLGAPKADEQEWSRAAEDKDADAHRAKECEMWFYLAQKSLLEEGRPTEQVRSLLEKCKASVPPHRLEATMAAGMLKQF